MHVVRFDTVVFNPETHTLEVWRYREGLYSGKHELVLSVETNIIKGDADFREVMKVIMKVAGRSGFSEEPNLPSPWRGYRFV